MSMNDDYETQRIELLDDSLRSKLAAIQQQRRQRLSSSTSTSKPTPTTPNTNTTKHPSISKPTQITHSTPQFTQQHSQHNQSLDSIALIDTDSSLDNNTSNSDNDLSDLSVEIINPDLYRSREVISSSTNAWQEEDLHQNDYDYADDENNKYTTNTNTTMNDNDDDNTNSDSDDGFISLKEQINIVALERDAKLGLINSSTMHRYLPTFLPPWIPPNPIDLYHYYHAPLFQRLHNEILMFIQYLKPTIDEDQQRHGLIRRLKVLTSKLFPGSRLEVFGSSTTNTQLPFGDVDLVLFKEPKDFEQRQITNRQRIIESIQKDNASNRSRFRTPIPDCDFSRNIFTLMATYLQQELLATDIEVISKARVPVLKFIDVETGLRVDVTINSYSGTEAAAFMQQQMEYFPQLQPLTMIIKYFLYIRGLNEAFTGGIGSFAIQCMLIAMLQRHPSRFKSQIINYIYPPTETSSTHINSSSSSSSNSSSQSMKNTMNDNHSNNNNSIDLSKASNSSQALQLSSILSRYSIPKPLQKRIDVPHINTTITNLGLLLFSFFRMYTFEVNYHKIKIDISSEGAIGLKSTSPRPSTHSNGNTPLLMLLNPLDLTHDMTSNSYNIHNIRQAFLHGYHVILNHLICADPIHYSHTLANNNNNSNINNTNIFKTMNNNNNNNTKSNPPPFDRAQHTIKSTLLSELLPVCPELVEIRPSYIQLPQSFQEPRNSLQLDQYCQRVFGTSAAEYLFPNTTNKKNHIVPIIRLTQDEIDEMEQDDMKLYTTINPINPESISLDPIHVYLLMKKAYSTTILQQNQKIYQEYMQHHEFIQSVILYNKTTPELRSNVLDSNDNNNNNNTKNNNNNNNDDDEYMPPKPKIKEIKLPTTKAEEFALKMINLNKTGLPTKTTTTTTTTAETTTALPQSSTMGDDNDHDDSSSHDTTTTTTPSPPTTTTNVDTQQHLSTSTTSLFTRLPSQIPQNFRFPLDLLELPDIKTFLSPNDHHLYESDPQFKHFVSTGLQYIHARCEDIFTLLKICLSQIKKPVFVRLLPNGVTQYEQLKQLSTNRKMVDTNFLPLFPFQTMDYASLIHSTQAIQQCLTLLNRIFQLPMYHDAYIAQILHKINNAKRNQQNNNEDDSDNDEDNNDEEDVEQNNNDDDYSDYDYGYGEYSD